MWLMHHMSRERTVRLPGGQIITPNSHQIMGYTTNDSLLPFLDGPNLSATTPDSHECLYSMDPAALL